MPCGDVDGNGAVRATDALMVLRKAVGLPVQLVCPSCQGSTTTIPAASTSTSSSTSTTTAPTTTVPACTSGGCDDGNVCTDDSCDPRAGCVHTNNTAPCDDGNACTTGDQCSAGVCQGGAPANCDDGNVCTNDLCDPKVGCVHTNNTAPGAYTHLTPPTILCSGGICQGGAAVDCDDGNPCTDDACDPKVGCVHTNNTALCDDGNACTTLDVCSEGVCTSGAPADCSDDNPCTTDLCDPDSGCVHLYNTASCDDGNACTTNDRCSGGTCQGQATIDCDDGNPCTNDLCDATSGCLHIFNTAPCDDGNACTTGDQCSAGVCQGGAPTNCDDGNPCTNDLCSSATGCLHFFNTAPCDDGNACTTGDQCSAGVCQGGAPTNCDDGNECTDDSCDPATGCTHHVNPYNSCSDGDPCTWGDHCLPDGTCSGTASPWCQ